MTTIAVLAHVTLTLPESVDPQTGAENKLRAFVRDLRGAGATVISVTAETDGEPIKLDFGQPKAL